MKSWKEQETRKIQRGGAKGQGEFRVMRMKKKGQEGIRVKRGGRKDKVEKQWES